MDAVSKAAPDSEGCPDHTTGQADSLPVAPIAQPEESPGNQRGQVKGRPLMRVFGYLINERTG
jgi:hypothetical protein